MEALTRIVAESLARHGFDNPLDPRRLQWSRWSRCDSPHSLLVVPSKPGIFAIAEEIMDLGTGDTLLGTAAAPGNRQVGDSKSHVGTAALGCPAERSPAAASSTVAFDGSTKWEGHDCDPEPALSKRSAPKDAASGPRASVALAAEVAALAADGKSRGPSPPEAAPARRMLAVLQFSEDDDMAFTLDRMFTRIHPMRARLASARCFVRFVVLEDRVQRRSICSALNQWMLSSAGKASSLLGFCSTLEPTDHGRDGAGRTLFSTNSGQAHSDNAGTIAASARATSSAATENLASLGLEIPLPQPDSGANRNLHCPHPLPSGF